MVTSVHAEADQIGLGGGKEALDVGLGLDGRIAVRMKDQGQPVGVPHPAGQPVHRVDEVGEARVVEPSRSPLSGLGIAKKIVQQHQEAGPDAGQPKAVSCSPSIMLRAVGPVGNGGEKCTARDNQTTLLEGRGGLWRRSVGR